MRTFSSLGKYKKVLDDDIFEQTGDSYTGYSQEDEQTRTK